MSSLRQLYSVSMDIHNKFAKDQDFEPRWNERFLLSLVRCDTCLVVDDELNVLPISKNKAFLSDWSTSTSSNELMTTSSSKNNNGVEQGEDEAQLALLGASSSSSTSSNMLNSKVSSSLEIALLHSKNAAELQSLKEDLKDAQPLGNL